MGWTDPVEAVGLLPAASNAVELHRTVLCLVAAVSDLRGALEVGLLGLAERAGVDLRGQRDGRGGQDKRGDKALGEHGASPLGLGRAWSDTRALAGRNIPPVPKSGRELAPPRAIIR